MDFLPPKITSFSLSKKKAHTRQKTAAAAAEAATTVSKKGCMRKLQRWRGNIKSGMHELWRKRQRNGKVEVAMKSVPLSMLTPKLRSRKMKMNVASLMLILTLLLSPQSLLLPLQLASANRYQKQMRLMTKKMSFQSQLQPHHIPCSKIL
jgi:hypothetical protein